MHRKQYIDPQDSQKYLVMFLQVALNRFMFSYPDKCDKLKEPVVHFLIDRYFHLSVSLNIRFRNGESIAVHSVKPVVFIYMPSRKLEATHNLQMYSKAQSVCRHPLLSCRFSIRSFSAIYYTHLYIVYIVILGNLFLYFFLLLTVMWTRQRM